MFFDIYEKLCKERGITVSKAAEEMGINKGTVSAWRNKGTYPQVAQLQKMAAYFSVSTDFLLGLEKEKGPTRQNGEASDDDIKFALFEGATVTDEQFEEVKRFAKYVRDRDIHST